MILIVDDDNAVRMSLSLALKRAGYEPVAVGNEEDALVAVRDERVQLTVLDMNLTLSTTGQQGIATLRKFRILRPDMPVIMITGWGTIPLAVETMNLGAADFITKPWSNADLLAKIKKALAKSESEKEASERTETLDEMERDAIKDALRRCDGNLSEAAKQLGITRQSLYRRIEKIQAMRYKVYFGILVLLIVITAVVAGIGVAWQWIAGLCMAALVVSILLIHSVITPLQAVQNGMYLLREQDFSSRLRPTGQADADKVVELYNTLIDSMKAERLKNLEQNRFLQLVVDASPLGIAVCDFNGAIVQTNRAWTLMQSPALSKAIDELADGETATVRLADALIVRISKLWFMDSGFRRRFILVERLTEEIASAEKQMFSKIVRTIGHEVNNTLGSVISVLDTLQTVYAGDSLEFNAIDSSRNSCHNLVSFVRGYADIVKLPEASPEFVDIHAWLCSLLPTLRGMAPSNISMNYGPSAESVKAFLDTMLMERVLINIVKNSIESIGCRDGGFINISIEKADGRNHARRLIITDNGKGISADNASKLFTPFFSTKRPDRGLGLMLITDILRAHRFPFSLSTSQSTGLTAFTIVFEQGLC